MYIHEMIKPKCEWYLFSSRLVSVWTSANKQRFRLGVMIRCFYTNDAVVDVFEPAREGY